MEFGEPANQHSIDLGVGAGNPAVPRVIPGLQPIGLATINLAPVLPQLVAPLGFGFSPDMFIRMEMERSLSLYQMMINEGLVPSPEEEIRRRNAIHKLKKIVMEWIKRVAYRHQLPKRYLRSASATILTYGSYGLGVHNSESDIDVLCVVPCFANMVEDFFVVLYNILASRPEISEIQCIKDAKVPLMRFKFDGIPIDLPYAQLKVVSIPENVDVFNPFFMRNIDESSWRSLSGIRANRSIMYLLPNIELFQSLLRCIKLWAKRRGLYGNLVGFFGGIHLAVLSAFICQKHPTASLSTLVSIFFKTFAFWPCPTPVVLHDGLTRPFIPSEKLGFLPIQLPGSECDFCHSNITRSTFQKIRTEFLRGHVLIKDMLSPAFDWTILFEPFPYSKKYGRLLKIYLSASDKDGLGNWVGCVKSRFRWLLVKLEELLQGFCDPNPTEYIDIDESEVNVVFYWGLQPGRNNFIDIESVEDEFMKNISNIYQGSTGRMKLSIVRSSQLPKKAEYSNSSSCCSGYRSWKEISAKAVKHKGQQIDGGRYLGANNGNNGAEGA
nr:nuclear poly(A) polymerase 3 [Ipomoea batatas]